MNLDRFSDFLFRNGSLVFAAFAVLFGVGNVLYQQYNERFATHSVIVATTPTAAEIYVDDRPVASSPATLQLKRGTYTLRASKRGFEDAVHAVFVSNRETNIVNLQLLPTNLRANQQVPIGVAVPNQEGGALAQLEREVATLKAALNTNPDDAISLLVLREKLRVHEEVVKSLREDIRDIKEQSKWYVGSLIAIVVGLLTVIATLFVGKRKEA